ncbi:MAG TPA: right-handed parallel beta-helix repeat-containing protein, partial [Chthoniobacteraceae bacterium]|nr:right-handed parallel beta-helix repeat-containing protein [Chthoniobacteraceae bacterium]
MTCTSVRLCIEPLETRIAPATLFVDNANDFIITTDTGTFGLSAGDTVTWDPGAGSGHGAAVTGLIFGTNAFATIGAAIAASAINDQIKVGPGTFNETLVVNKTLNIQGNQVGVDATTRSGTPETVVSSAGAGFTVSASNVRITGFTIQGSGTTSLGIATNNAVSGFTVSNNIITGHQVGLRLNTFAGGAESNVLNNLFVDNDSSASSIGIESNLRLENVLISGNTFGGVHNRAAIDLTFDTATGRNIVIERNTLAGSPGATGIIIASDVPETSRITIRNNFINGWANGVTVNDPPEGITIRGNHLAGNTSSALNGTGTALIDAKFNFYGPTDLSGVDAEVNGPYDFQPFLTDGTDADLATRGFQPLLKATLVNDTTATYSDPDGDLVTVKVSKGTLSDADFRFELPERGGGFILAELLLSDDSAEFDQANLTITAKRTAAGGDGLALIQEIDATGVDLGNIKVKGDLAVLFSGDADLATKAAGRIDVVSATTASGRIPLYRFNRSVDAFIAAGDFLGTFQTLGGAQSSLGSLLIGGTAGTLGGSLAFLGQFDITGNLGPATIRGDLNGSAFDVGGNLAKLTVGGSVIGVDNFNSGYVKVIGNTGPIKIAGSLVGGTDFNTGAIQITGNAGPITIGGSVLGGFARDGSAFNSGLIEVTGHATAITVRGSVIGGRQVDSNSIFDTGSIQVGSAGKVFIGGDLIGTDDFTTGRLSSVGDVGSLAIGGSV